MTRKDNSEFAKEVAKVAKNKAEVKSLGDAIGMPDSWDRANIKALIAKWSRRKFKVEGFVVSGSTVIKMCLDEARRDHQVDNISNPYNFKIKESEVRAVTAIPQGLSDEIEQAYPTMFREKKHFSWFVRNFPQFKISEKY